MTEFSLEPVSLRGIHVAIAPHRRGGVSSRAMRRSFKPLSLDAVNFLAADVQGAPGPYLNVFLVTRQHWSQADVGLVITTGGLLGIFVQTPIGAAIDEMRGGVRGRDAGNRGAVSAL
jgi:hypothetical protein